MKNLSQKNQLLLLHLQNIRNIFQIDEGIKKKKMGKNETNMREYPPYIFMRLPNA